VRTLRRLSFLGAQGPEARFASDLGPTLVLTCLEPTIFRLSLRDEKGWKLPRTWCVAWDQKEVPF